MSRYGPGELTGALKEIESYASESLSGPGGHFVYLERIQLYFSAQQSPNVLQQNLGILRKKVTEWENRPNLLGPLARDLKPLLSEKGKEEADPKEYESQSPKKR